MGLGTTYASEPLLSLVGFWTWNVRTNIVVTCRDVCEYVNVSGASGLHGIDAQRFVDAIHPDDREELARRVEAAMAGGDVLVAEYRLRSLRHGTRWVRSSGRCFRDASGQAAHISGYLVEIEDPLADDPNDRHVYDAVIDHLTKARDAASDLPRPMLGKLIEAVLREAGYQLARRTRKA